MSVNIYRIWLPLSLGLHLVLLLLCNFIPVSVAQTVQGPSYHIVRMDEPLVPKPKMPTHKPLLPALKPKLKPLPLKTKPVTSSKVTAPVPTVPDKVPTPAKVNPVISALPKTGKGAENRPRDMAQWGELKQIAQLNPTASSAPARQLAPRIAPLHAPPLSAGGPGSMDFTPHDLPGSIDGIVTSTRGTLPMPTAPIGGTHSAPFRPGNIGMGPYSDRPGVSGFGGDGTPSTPNLSRVTTLVPGASAPGAAPASVFRPGFPGGPIPSDGGSSLVPDHENPAIPFGLPGGKPGGRGNVVADPKITIGPGTGGDNGAGPGPGRPAHGPVLLPGPRIRYPSLAEKEGNSGNVIVLVAVDPDGDVSSTNLEKRSESDALDNAAVVAARQRTFRPAEDGHGHQISKLVRLEFRFVLGKEVEVKQL